MKKIKFIFTIALFSLLLYACNNDDTEDVEVFDHEAQALIDQDTLTKFFSNYYYDTDIDSIKPLVAGKMALSKDSVLKTQIVIENDIEYKLYYYVTEADLGVGTPVYDPITKKERRKSFPTVMDSILSTYQVWNISKTDSISLQQTGTKANWWNLAPSSPESAPTPIRGWSYGFTHFKGGENITNNGPTTYEKGGKGILFIPSGLAYRNVGSGGSISANENLIFYINLYDFVENTDHDSDGIPSINEDPDGNGDPRDDDTDEDNIPNYFDDDDDGDGILSIYEDTNNDGDYTNDDTDGDGTPDYLDQDN